MEILAAIHISVSGFCSDVSDLKKERIFLPLMLLTAVFSSAHDEY